MKSSTTIIALLLFSATVVSANTIDSKKDPSIGSTLTRRIAGFGHSMYSIGSSSNEVSDDGSEDKTPTGGAPCQKDLDCGGVDGGTCDLTTTNNVTTGKCVCSDKRADVDCSYKRKNGQLAGGLQFLCFAGVGGVGNFILERTGQAIGQLVLLAIPLCSCCIIICGGLVGGASGSEELGGAIAGCLGLCICCASLAGLVWCIVDGAMILEGDVVDGNGYMPWLP
jgi:hypothetical protein